MTLHQQIGQLCMIGIPGAELSREVIAWIKEFQPGGVILFSRNLVDPQQISQLTTDLQAANVGPHPLLIAIDQEGGRVSRLPASFTIFPPAATLAQTGSPQLVYEAAAVTAAELRAVGITMNMAPVLDVNTNVQNPIIGNRAFGEHPDPVCRFGEAVIAGLQDHGVLACGKHFPGHGETQVDSHEELPFVSVSKTRLEQVELVPFRHAVHCGVAAMMTAHVVYAALDDRQAATFSSTVLENLLRQDLGFEGVIFTDDLEMNAVSNHMSMGEAGVRALRAGADILLICHRQDRQTEAIESVVRAVENGELSMARIDQSLARLHRLRERSLASPSPGGATSPEALVGMAKHRQVLDRIHAAVAQA